LATFGEGDPLLYGKAVDLVSSTRKASISGLQRTLKIGYNRAARLIEQLEGNGIVSVPDDRGFRSVLSTSPS
jgi:S-DNA-T family DNA segregation ATPase FtsK/SpoIIIE